jgi:hypothetical protein
MATNKPSETVTIRIHKTPEREISTLETRQQTETCLLNPARILSTVTNTPSDDSRSSSTARNTTFQKWKGNREDTHSETNGARSTLLKTHSETGIGWSVVGFRAAGIIQLSVTHDQE